MEKNIPSPPTPIPVRMASSGSLPLSTFDTTATAKSLQSCPTLCDPIDGPPGSHQAPPSLGFSRQEHWNGLLFSSQMYESEKWKRSCSIVSDSQRPQGLQPTRLLRPWDFPGKSNGVGCHFSSLSTCFKFFQTCSIIFICRLLYLQRVCHLHEAGDFFSNPEPSVLAANQHYSFRAIRCQRG